MQSEPAALPRASIAQRVSWATSSRRSTRQGPRIPPIAPKAEAVTEDDIFVQAIPSLSLADEYSSDEEKVLESIARRAAQVRFDEFER